MSTSPVDWKARLRISKNAAICNALCGTFCNPAAFEDIHDEFVLIRQILNRRAKDELRASDRLVFLCRRYVDQFSKRNTIYLRYGGSRSISTQDHWTKKVKFFLEEPFAGRWSLLFYVLLSLFVLLSGALIVIQTIPSFNSTVNPDLEKRWLILELCIGSFFIIEIIVRCATVTLQPEAETMQPWYINFRDFWRSPGNVLDALASVIPSVVEVIGERQRLGFFNLFRLLRVFRIFFLLRRFEVFEDLEETLRRALSSLAGPLIGLLVALTGFASIIYSLESGTMEDSTKIFYVRNEDCELSAPDVLGLVSCPRTESTFISIVHSMWYVLITFLTVGYGDMVPLTSAGRGVSGVAIITGSLLLSMPIAIVGTNFTFVVDTLRRERRYARLALERKRSLRHPDMQLTHARAVLPPPLPSLAFFRFLRIALRCDTLDFRKLSQPLHYFIALYFHRVVHEFMQPAMSDTVDELNSRASMKRKAFSARISLVCGKIKHVIPLTRPITLHVGTNPMADVRLLSPSVSAAVLAEFHRRLVQRTTLEYRLRAPTNRDLPDDVLSFYADVSCRCGEPKLLADDHLVLTLVNYGGSHNDQLFVEPVVPYTTLLNSHMLRNRVQISNQKKSVLRFDPAVQRDDEDLIKINVQFGVPFRVIKPRNASV